MNLSATLGPSNLARNGRPVKLYDCGKLGKLTAKQIGTRAGVSVFTVYERVRLKWPPEDLAEPAHVLRKRKSPGASKPCVVTAVRIATAYPGRVPSVREIQKVAPMCDVAARRWRRAWLDVHGEAA